jgi:hypothetical protein
MSKDPIDVSGITLNFHELPASENLNLSLIGQVLVKDAAQYIIYAFNKRSKVVNA